MALRHTTRAHLRRVVETGSGIERARQPRAISLPKLSTRLDTDTGELRYALDAAGPLAAGRLEVAVKRLDDSVGVTATPSSPCSTRIPTTTARFSISAFVMTVLASEILAVQPIRRHCRIRWIPSWTCWSLGNTQVVTPRLLPEVIDLSGRRSACLQLHRHNNAIWWRDPCVVPFRLTMAESPKSDRYLQRR